MPMEKRWIIGEQPKESEVDALSSKLNISPAIASVLIQRGISDFESARNFFRPDISRLHDPFLMKDMEEAVDRLNKAIENKEHILIYGDYDVDGTTSVALVMGILRDKVERLSYYINDRSDEGYGISEQGILWAEENDVTLIISLDCGIKAGKLVSKAKQKGIDFIICDHHTTGSELPDAVAVLDPKREDCNYPYKELSGCGVGFKLMQGLFKKRDLEQSILFKRLDLVAVSISADIVPITGENRILCYYGLKALNTDPLPGLKALIDLSSQGKLDVTGVVFGLAPRINAAGRMAHARGAVDLLLAPDLPAARKIAEEVNENNTRRRTFDTSITKEALEIIRSWPDRKSSVVFKEDWHLGVLGIVASRCIEHFHKPTIVLTRSNGNITGSARSVPGYNIYDAINQCSDLLTKFGGHDYAAGLTLNPERLQEFTDRFEQVVASTIEEELLKPPVFISTSLSFDKISMNFVNVIEQMEPFGPGNEAPVFYSDHVYFLRKVDVLKEKHIKFVAGQKGAMKTFEAIGFGMADYADKINGRDTFRMAYCVEKNYYRGETTIQLRIKDIQCN